MNSVGLILLSCFSVPLISCHTSPCAEFLTGTVLVLGSQLSLMWKSAPLRNTELFKGSFHSSHLMFSLFGCLDPN